MSSSLEYLQSKHIAEFNSTSEQEEFSEKDKEDAMKPLSYQDSVEAMENWDQKIHETQLNYSKSDTGESQHHRNPALSDPQETVSAYQLLNGHEDEDMQWKTEEVHNLLLLLAVLAASITYLAGMSPPGAQWQENKADHVVGNLVPNDNHRRHYIAFFYCNATAFLSSVVIIVLLVNRKLFARGIQSNVLSACLILDLIGLTGAFAAFCSRRVSTFICVFILLFAVLVCIMVKVLVRVGSGSPAETSVLGHKAEDMKLKLETRRELLPLLAVLAASVTYQAGLSPPGGFWQENKADNDNHRRRYMVFFYCNATAFLSSLAIIVLLVIRKLSARGMQSSVLSACLILDQIGLTGAFAAASSRRVSTSIYIIILVFAVLVYIMLHVLVRIGSGSLAETSVLGHKDEDMKWKPEKRRKLLLLLAVLAVSVTYQAGLSPPGSLWQENKADHVVGDPVPNDNHRRRYMALFYCNATAFVSSLATIVLLMSRKLFERGTQSNVLSACVNLDLIGLTGAFAAISSRRVSTSIYVFILLFAVLVCIMAQVLGRVGSGSLAETSVLGHNGGRSRYLLIFATLDLFGQIGANAAGRCSESADTAVVYEDNPNRSIKRSPHEATWRVVCSAPHHMTGNQNVLLTSSYLVVHDGSNDGEVVFVNPANNGETVPLRVQGSGSVRTESIALDDVWHVPGLDSNLVSTGQLARQGCAVNLGPGGCRVTRDGALVGTARFTEECQFELDFLKVAASSM